MGGVSSCLGAEGGAQNAGAPNSSAAVAEAVPLRVAEVGGAEVSVHPNHSVVQLRIRRYQEGVGTWEGAASGFVFKDAHRNCIITAGRAVSRGSAEEAHGIASRIEMGWNGHCFTIEDPVEGLDFVVHPQWRQDSAELWVHKYDVACVRFIHPSSAGRFLSNIVGGMGLELSQVSPEIGSVCRIVGYGGGVRSGEPCRPGPLYQNLDVLLPRMAECKDRLIKAVPLEARG